MSGHERLAANPLDRRAVHPLDRRAVHPLDRLTSRSLGRLAAVALALVVAGCSGPILANEAVVRPTPLPSPAATPAPADPQPIVLPRDDGPHHRLTEWWYYTGHLHDATGHTFGFEFVVFRAERGPLPVTWASHLAITDETGGRFYYAQRSEIGPQVDRSPRGADGVPDGFALAVSGAAPGSASGLQAWSMAGSGGHDSLNAAMSPTESRRAGASSAGLQLELRAEKPAVLHDGDGWIDFGPAGGSYYYSRTSLAATGTVSLDGRTLEVTGDAWFDHQWGDFIAVGAGGWDWFAMNLADGTDVTLSLVRAADGTFPLVYGTLVSSDGTAVHLASTDFRIAVTAYWGSPHTGADYPAGWTIDIPARGLRVELTPTVADQELDTRATTGVAYWEGSQRVVATRDGKPLAGQAYVELTGYAPAGR